jgi:uncharacterized damage-inducible protein DinB
MDLLDRLVGHDRWITARLLELSRDLTDAHLDQPFDIGHQTLRATFDHMIFNVGFWTALMAEQPVTTEREGRRSIAALIERHERLYATFASFARRARDEQRLDDTFVDHFAFRQTVGATIIHVVWHNAQHRGEALHILARLGVPDLPEGDPQEWEHATQGS